MKNYSTLDYFVLAIITSFPILLITGPFLSDLFCIILGLIFISQILNQEVRHKIFKYYKFYIYFFIFFYFYININSLFGFDPKISFLTSVPFIRIILFIFGLAFFFYKFNILYKLFYITYFICISVLFIDSILIFLFETNIFNKETLYTNRISSLFGDEKIMGSYITRLLPICLGCSFIIDVKNKSFLNFIIISIAGILVFLSGERLAAFYYLGTIFVYILINKKNYFKSISTLTFVILIVILSNYQNPNIFGRFYTNTINQLNETNSYLSYRHTLHLKTAYEMFLDKKILGHGLKSFRHKCSEEKYENSIQLKQKKDLNNLNKINNSNLGYITEFNNGCNTHPHNIFLEHLAELGLIGFLFLITIYFYVLFNFIKHFFQIIFLKIIRKENFAKSMILGGIILQFFPLVPSGSYFNNYMMIIMFLSFGFYLSLINNQK